jgi:hypothetical protein
VPKELAIRGPAVIRHPQSTWSRITPHGTRARRCLRRSRANPRRSCALSIPLGWASHGEAGT